VTLLEVCRWIQNSSLLVAMRSSPWLFPIVATIHLFGLAIIGGSIWSSTCVSWGWGCGAARISACA
jgi:hypothetical protein